MSKCRQALERAFPFHLRIAPDGTLLAAGPSLRKALPALRPGRPVGEHLEFRRPRGLLTLEDWRRHDGGMVVLRGHGEPPLMLRGGVHLDDDGSVWLLVAAMFTRMEQLSHYALGLPDFAAHDASGDMLLLHQTARMSLDDATRLATSLQARTHQLETVIELNPHGVGYFDAAGRLLQANSGLRELLGLPPGEAAPATLDQVQRHLDAACAEPVEPPRLAELAQRGPCSVNLLRGRVVELSARASDDGGLAIHLQDITHQTEVDRMKSEFLTTAAHELRTPMVSVLGFSELLLNREMPAERRRDMTQTIHRQATLLVQIVNELLDLARIEARRGLDFAIHAQPLVPLVEETLAACRGGPSHHWRVELAHHDECVAIDAAKTRQAIGNVLSNAVKFSPDGGEIVMSTRLCAEGGTRRLGLVVADQGIGMDEVQLSHIFERFYRADPSGNIPGSGLGMSLVREIMELQGGSVDVASRLGFGTSVTLWFPLAGPASCA
ncbi:MAG: ATP-binding protein [Piscinibacter sp.]|uniref:ATP-binding protein n=1 Tax=Piscinibacter sp. TaxID=1903157 RepID=UPI003D0CF4F9